MWPVFPLKQVPKAWLHKIDDMVKAAGGKPFDDQNRRLYAAMTLYMDAAIGEAVEALKKKDGMGGDGGKKMRTFKTRPCVFDGEIWLNSV